MVCGGTVKGGEIQLKKILSSSLMLRGAERGHGTGALLFCRLEGPSHDLWLRVFLKKILFIYLFLWRGEGREKEKYQCVVASHAPPTGDLACNPGMCPTWELNR